MVKQKHIKIKWSKIKAHNNNLANEKADKLAKLACSKSPIGLITSDTCKLNFSAYCNNTLINSNLQLFLKK